MNVVFDKELIKMAEEITGSDYKADGYIIDKDNLEFMVEELIYRYKELEDKFADYVKEVDENYKRSNSDPYLEYGVSPQDF
jgi:hypothetical protein